MNKHTWLTGLAVLLVLTVGSVSISTSLRDPPSFEEQVIRLGAEINPRCTVRLEVLEAQPLPLMGICSEYGTLLYEAATLYPEQAPKLFAMYGAVAEWEDILRRYGGHEVIPIVWSFVTEGSVVQTATASLKKGIAELWSGQLPSLEGAKLTPWQHGLLAILAIHEHGHRFLDGYEVVDGTAKEKPVANLMSHTVRFFTSGINALEKKYTRGDEIALDDVGGAAIDVAILALGGHALVAGLKKHSAVATAKALKAKGLAAKGVTVKGVIAKQAAYGAGTTLLAVAGKVAPYAALGGFGYLAVTHPIKTTVLTTGALQWTMEQVGLPAQAAFLLSWLLMVTFLWLLAWPVITAGRLGYKGARLAVRPVRAVVARRNK